jgi:CheY-like chemotaxis protein
VPEEKPTILVVDDDPDVLELAVAVLSDVEASILTATSGDDALVILEGEQHVDLLFTDIVMPGRLNGFELAHEAKRLRPELRVLYTSGYMRDVPWSDYGLGYGKLLNKPWTPGQLTREVRQALA